MTERATYGVRDALLAKTKALPNGADSMETDPLDLGALTERGALVAGCELKIEAPALAAAELPDGETMTYSVECDADQAFGSARLLADKVLVQTGAGGAGAAAAEARFRLPTDVERYVRVKATNSGVGDCSGKSMTVSLLT